MGVAQSKNVARELANISNQIAQNTTQDQDTTINLDQLVSFDGCDLRASEDVVIKQSTENYIKAIQLSKALQNANVINDIAQKLAQEAQSSVGFLGFGFASASNAASTEANATTEVSNAINNSISNFLNVRQTFSCVNSTIQVKNFTLDQGSFSDIVSNQTAENQQIVDISNSITQDISQKASAKVQGIAGYLLAIAIIIAACGYAFSKSANSKPVQIGMSAGIIIGIVILFAWMYSVHAPPFFAKPVYIHPYAFSGQNGSADTKKIVEIKKNVITLDKPPLKYLYPLISCDIKEKPNISLLELVVRFEIENVKQSKSNSGFNLEVALDVNENFKLWYNNYRDMEPKSEIEFPDLMTYCFDGKYILIPDNMITNSGNLRFDNPSAGIQCSDPEDFAYRGQNCFAVSDKKTPKSHILALENKKGFSEYAAISTTHALFLRYILCEKIGFFNNYYIGNNDENEFVTYIDDDGKTKKGIVSQVIKDGKGSRLLRIINIPYSNPNQPILGSVDVESEFGVESSLSYKTSKNFKKWGIYLLIIFIIFIIVWIFIRGMIFKKK